MAKQHGTDAHAINASGSFRWTQYSEHPQPRPSGGPVWKSTKPSTFMKFLRFLWIVSTPATHWWLFECLKIMALKFTCTFLFTFMKWESWPHLDESPQHADPDTVKDQDPFCLRPNSPVRDVHYALPTTGTRHNRRDEFINRGPVSHIIPKTFCNVLNDKGLFGIES